MTNQKSSIQQLFISKINGVAKCKVVFKNTLITMTHDTEGGDIKFDAFKLTDKRNFEPSRNEVVELVECIKDTPCIKNLAEWILELNTKFNIGG